MEFISQFNSNPLVRKLDAFIDNKKFKMAKKSKYTNITNQRKSEGCYYVPFGNEFISSSNIIFDVSEEQDDNSTTILENHISEQFDKPSLDFKYPIEEFFALLEECRLNGIILGFCEKQYFTVPVKKKTLAPVPSDVFSSTTNELPLDDEISLLDDIDDNQTIKSVVEKLSDDIEIEASCIELDFDIYQKTSHRFIEETHYYTLVHSISSILAEQLDFGNMPYPNGVVERNGVNTFVKFHVAILSKPKVMETNHKKYGKCWKESFHMRFFVKTTKSYKRYLIQTINERSILSIVFGSNPILNTPAEILDPNSPYFPSMLLGSAKNGSKVPQQFVKLYLVSFGNWPIIAPVLTNLSDFNAIPTDEKPRKVKNPIDRRTNIVVQPVPKHNYNLCFELSLNYEAPGGLIKKREVPPRQDIISMIQSQNERSSSGILSNGEIEEARENVHSLTVRNYEAKYIQLILDIISTERVSEYETWKSIIVMLARENPDYKPLAIYFSQRCPQSWVKGGAEQLDGIWEWALSRPNNKNNQDNTEHYRDIKTLYAWAKQDNPAKYQEIQDYNAFMKAYKMAFEFSGRLHETHLAEILRVMWGHLFIVDENEFSTAKGRDRRWYQFVFPEEQKYDSGAAYKWRLEKYPDELDKYICKKLPQFIKKVRAFIKQKCEDSAADEAAQKYYITVGKNLEDSEASLGKSSMIRNIISRCEIEFRERGFLENLDKDPNVIGVGNGVLRLYPTTELIQRFHEIPISRSTRVPYVYEKVDPNDPKFSTNHSNPYIRHLFTEIQRLFAGQDDAFTYTMCYLASSLDGRKKKPLFFLWLGEGSNGKSFLLELHIKTLHSVVQGGYAAKINSSFFTKDSKTHGGPDSEKMMLKHARFAYCSESQEGDVLQMAKIKEYTSETLSGNEKHQTQDMFEANCYFVFCTNNDPRITGRDYGTWRRIIVYTFKIKFVDNPDPDNKYEYKCDQRLVNEVPFDIKYRQAYLTILMYYYELYRDVYHCNLSRIPKQTIDDETQKYKDEQDTIEKYITQQIVKIGEHYPSDNNEPPTKVADVGLSDLANKYVEWHKRKIGDLSVPVKDIIKAFPQTRLKRFIVKRFEDEYLTQHRVLNIGEEFDRKKYSVEEKKEIPQAPIPIPVPIVDDVVGSREDNIGELYNDLDEIYDDLDY